MMIIIIIIIIIPLNIVMMIIVNITTNIVIYWYALLPADTEIVWVDHTNLFVVGESLLFHLHHHRKFQGQQTMYFPPSSGREPLTF